MFNWSRVFAHYLFVESKRWSGGGAPSVWRFWVYTIKIIHFKGRVHYFSMHVVMNKYFLVNPEKNLAQIRLVIFEINAPLIPKNDITEPRLEG